MSDMPCPRRTTPGDGRVTRQGTSLLYIAGEKTKASAPWGTDKITGSPGDFSFNSERIDIMEEYLTVCGENYRLIRLLGRGKGGYSYLAEKNGKAVVLKQIHHEPCDYYAFGNKIEAEHRDYQRLQQAGIRIPEMISIDEDAERIVKEYIPGETVFDIIRDGKTAEPYMDQITEMAEQAKRAGLNIDYFPTNFVVCDGVLWYIDYECNDYMEQWDFKNWGVRYWSRTPEFEEYLNRQ